MKIETHYDCPPIPHRGYDWSAATSDYELGDPVGHGATEQEAIDDLLEQLEFENCCPMCEAPLDDSRFCGGCREAV